MKSRRLPGKVMLPILGKPMLQHVVEGVIDLGRGIPIVATTDDKSDNKIERWCHDYGIECFRDGLKPERLYDWYLAIGKAYNADLIMRVCGDSPCVDTRCAGSLAMRADFGEPETDYYSWKVNGHPAVTQDYGIHTEVFRYEALVGMAPIKHLHQRHCTTAFYAEDGTTATWLTDPGLAAVLPFRLTVDTKVDYNRICALAEKIGHVPHDWREYVHNRRMWSES